MIYTHSLYIQSRELVKPPEGGKDGLKCLSLSFSLSKRAENAPRKLRAKSNILLLLLPTWSRAGPRRL